MSPSAAGSHLPAFVVVLTFYAFVYVDLCYFVHDFFQVYVTHYGE